MRKWFLIGVIVFVIVEIWGISLVSAWIGGMSATLLLVLMAVLGAYLAQTEGRKVWAEAQRQIRAGQVPGRMMLDGLCVFAGGVLLAIPGFLSDIAGLTLLLPATRPVYRQAMLRWLEKRMRSGSFTIRRF